MAGNQYSVFAEAKQQTDRITAAVGHVFRCIVNPGHFDIRPDFATWGWTRRFKTVRAVLRTSAATRHADLQTTFEQFDDPTFDSMVRARILFFMQIGHDDTELNTSMEDRKALMIAYRIAFTGQNPTHVDIEALRKCANTPEDTQTSRIK